MTQKLTEIGHISLGRGIRGAKCHLLTRGEAPHRGVKQHQRLRALQANRIDRFLTAISKIFTDNNITLTPQMFEVMTEEDFISLKENIASAIGATTEQVDQAIQLAMKAQGN